MTVAIDIASGIADEVRATGKPRTWRKVTTILSAYGVYRLTGAVRSHITAEFAAAGLTCDPSMLTVDRSATVRLSLTSTASVPAQSESVMTNGSLPVGVTAWQRKDERWVASPLSKNRPGVVIIDIDLATASFLELAEVLPPALPGLDSAALDDLLMPDVRPRFKRSPAGSARRASAFVATPDRGDDASSSEQSVRLSLSLIEFVVGADWVLIARTPGQWYVDGNPSKDDRLSQTGLDYLASLYEHGLRLATSADEVAITIIDHAVASFGQAQADLASWVESWRIDFSSMASPDGSVLKNVQATLPLVIDALGPLRHPTVVTWMEPFAPSRALDVKDQVDRHLQALRTLLTTVATDLRSVDQVQGEQYQRDLATMAAVLLAPALVASVFGANAVLSDSPLDLIWLLLAMILAAGLTKTAITRRLGLGLPPIRHRRSE